MTEYQDRGKQDDIPLRYFAKAIVKELRARTQDDRRYDVARDWR